MVTEDYWKLRSDAELCGGNLMTLWRTCWLRIPSVGNGSSSGMSTGFYWGCADITSNMISRLFVWSEMFCIAWRGAEQSRLSHFRNYFGFRGGREKSLHTEKDMMSYLLTPWSRVLLEKLSGPQLVKKFLAFFGTRRFITAFTTARHLSLLWARSVHAPTSWWPILMLSSHLRLGLPSGLIPSVFRTNILYTPLLSPIRVTCPAHLILRAVVPFETCSVTVNYWSALMSNEVCSHVSGFPWPARSHIPS